MTDDLTFEPVSRYGSTRWCARALGRSEDWLRRNMDRLTAAGFPPPDPITGHRIKADVEAWIERRRAVCDTVPKSAARVDLDAF